MTTLEAIVEQFFIGRPHAPKGGEWEGWLIYAGALIAAGAVGYLLLLVWRS